MFAAILAFVTLFGPAVPLFTVEPFPGPRNIKEPGVQQELGITHERAYDVIYKYSADFNHVQRAWRAVPGRAQAMDKILSNFTPEQQKRLGELYIRVHEGTALLDSTIATKLNLTFRQRKRTQDIYDQSSLDFAKEIGRVRDMVYKELNFTPPPPDYNRDAAKSIMSIPRYVTERLQKERPYLLAWRRHQMQAVHKQVLALLDEDQRQAFERMKGKPPIATLPDAPHIFPGV